MKILITGGAGFIGQALCKYLSKLGYDVRLFDLKINHFEKNKRIEAFTGSILDTSAVNKAVSGCDIVVHLAALLGVRRSENERLECLNANINGTVNILDACVKQKIKKIIFSSSSEVYGDQDKILCEETDVKPKSIYAISKLAGEEYVKAYKLNYGLDYSIVRLFSVYGVGQVGEFVVPRFVYSAIKDISPTVYGDGLQTRSFCNSQDICLGIEKTISLKESNNEIINLGNPSEPITIKDLANKVINISGKSIKPVFIPLEESDRSAKREILNRMPNINKAKSILGYEPQISLDNGIKSMFDNGSVIESWYEPLSIFND